MRAVLNAVAGALGSDPDWAARFDTSQRGLLQSFGVAALTLPAYTIIARSVEVARAELFGDAAPGVEWLPFVLVTALVTFAFPFVAFVMSTIFERAERYPAWVVVRHWTVFLIAWGVAALFALYLLGVLPYSVPNFVLFVAMFGVLAADIRLAMRAGGFSLGSAVLIGSLVMSLSLSLMFVGLVLYLGTGPT